MKFIVGIFGIGSDKNKVRVVCDPKVWIEHHVDTIPFINFGKPALDEAYYKPRQFVGGGSYVSVTIGDSFFQHCCIAPCFVNMVFQEQEIIKFTARADDGTCWVYGFRVLERKKEEVK